MSQVVDEAALEATSKCISHFCTWLTWVPWYVETAWQHLGGAKGLSECRMRLCERQLAGAAVASCSL